MTIESIMAIVAATGIGAAVYGGLEIFKTWLKVAYTIPVIRDIVNAITGKLGMTDKDCMRFYDAIIKAIVFLAAWSIAYGMGANGDLLVLTGYRPDTSWLGFTLTALFVAFGDMLLDAYEQSKK